MKKLQTIRDIPFLSHINKAHEVRCKFLCFVAFALKL